MKAMVVKVRRLKARAEEPGVRATPIRPRNSPSLAGHERGESDLDDSTLWARSRAGDADAFTTLFERHATMIYNYCFRRVGDWAAAEGLLSIVFLEAWRRRQKHLPPGKVLPWLSTARPWRACRRPSPRPTSART
jgi:Sigma-70 region 2